MFCQQTAFWASFWLIGAGNWFADQLFGFVARAAFRLTFSQVELSVVGSMQFVNQTWR